MPLEVLVVGADSCTVAFDAILKPPPVPVEPVPVPVAMIVTPVPVTVPPEATLNALPLLGPLVGAPLM